MNLNWERVAKNTYNGCSRNIREHILNGALVKVQLNNAIRKNMAFTESNNEWSELPKNIKCLLIKFMEDTSHSDVFLHWKQATSAKKEEYK